MHKVAFYHVFFLQMQQHPPWRRSDVPSILRTLRKKSLPESVILSVKDDLFLLAIIQPVFETGMTRSLRKGQL